MKKEKVGRNEENKRKSEKLPQKVMLWENDVWVGLEGGKGEIWLLKDKREREKDKGRESERVREKHTKHTQRYKVKERLNSQYEVRPREEKTGERKIVKGQRM